MEPSAPAALHSRPAAWQQLLALRDGARAQGRADELLEDFVVLAGCAIADAEAMVELGRLTPARRRQIVLSLAKSEPPPTPFWDPAFQVIAEHDVEDVDDLRLAAWAGIAPSEAGWGALAPEVRVECVRSLVRAGVPRDPAQLMTLAQAQLAPADRSALVLAWCARRVFSHSAEEYQLVAELEPAARFEAMAAVLAGTRVPPAVAQGWAFEADAVWRLAPASGLGRVLADARMGAMAYAAGAEVEGEAMVQHALSSASPLPDPAQAGEAYGVVLGAAASIGIAPWLTAAETLTNDHRLLRSRNAFSAARASAVRTLARAALATPEQGGRYVESALDRGQEVLKEACRRVPDRWLDLLQRTTMAALLTQVERRTIEVQLSSIGDWLVLAWPDPSAHIELRECLVQLAQAAPREVAALAKRIGSSGGSGGGARSSNDAARWRLQAQWLATALPLLP